MVIVGIDEVGRGCWAGPVVAGAVILQEPILGLKDSKLLSRKQRERLARDISLQALAYGVGWVEAGVIDEIGLTAAVGLAMSRALAMISVPYEEVIIDGNLNFWLIIQGPRHSLGLTLPYRQSALLVSSPKLPVTSLWPEQPNDFRIMGSKSM